MQAGSRLYARRLRGDIGPIGIDPKTRLPGRILAPAVSLTRVDQFYDEVSPVQNFTLGSRMVGDERTFHYSFAPVALVAPCTYRLHISADQILQVNDRLSVAPAVVALDTTIVVDIASVAPPGGGAFQAGTVAANELVGGFIEVWPVAGGARFMWRRIIANTAAVAGAPTSITITVDRPFNLAAGIASGVTIHPSIYRNVRFPAAAGFESAVGLPPVPVPINNYFWLQTYGRCFVSPTGAWPGSVANFRDVYFHSDGCINSSLGEGIGGAGPSPQRVGYVVGAGNYGTAEIMLQLAP